VPDDDERHPFADRSRVRTGPTCVGTIAKETRLAQAKGSQHLAVLRAHGIVVSQRQGAETVYRIANPKIEDVCDLMREVLAEQAAERSKIIEAIRSEKQTSRCERTPSLDVRCGNLRKRSDEL
jgi:DNA-binding transcriptional ArsR family regulator